MATPHGSPRARRRGPASRVLVLIAAPTLALTGCVSAAPPEAATVGPGLSASTSDPRPTSAPPDPEASAPTGAGGSATTTGVESDPGSPSSPGAPDEDPGASSGDGSGVGSDPSGTNGTDTSTGPHGSAPPSSSTTPPSPSAPTGTTPPSTSTPTGAAGEVLLQLPLTESIDGVEVTGGTVRITAPGQYRLRGTLSGGQLLLAADAPSHLVLDGVDITTTDRPALALEGYAPVTLETVAGTVNTLTSQQDIAVLATPDLILKGGGDLQLSGSRRALSTVGELQIVSGSLQARAETSGIAAGDFVSHGGSVSITAPVEGLTTGSATGSGGTVTSSAATALRSESWQLTGGSWFLSGGAEAVVTNTATLSGTVEVTGRLVTFQDLTVTGGLHTLIGGAEVHGDLSWTGGTLQALGGSGDPAIRVAGSATGTGGTVRAHGAAGQPALQSAGGTSVSGGSGHLLVESGPPVIGAATLPAHLLVEFDGGPVAAGTLQVQAAAGDLVSSIDLPGASGAVLTWGGMTAGAEYRLTLGGSVLGAGVAQ